ncbi:MAG: CRTAC1 family protein [Pirellula sp.]
MRMLLGVGLRAAFLFQFATFLGCNDASQKGSNSSSASSSQLSNAQETKNEPKMHFSDVTQELGVKHTFRNGEEANLYTYLEAMGGGLAALDYDRDGRMDLFFPGGGGFSEDRTLVPLPGSLWRNLESHSFVDASSQSNIRKLGYYSQGVCSGDLNNDGFPELMVTGYGGVQLFWNQGDGTFVEQSAEVGLTDPQWSTSAAFGDFDGDSNLDVYVAHYVDWSWSKHPECNSTAGVRDICPPGAFLGLQDVVFMSNGDGSFRGVTKEIGLVPEGKGLGVVCADLNSDSKVDVYVANDATNNFLYNNLGDGRFEEIGVSSGTALDDRGNSNGSMGISVLDFDGDLLPDIWVCNYENETFALYKNDGNSNFRYVTSSAGVSALGKLFVAFGTVASDFDGDGDEDLVVTNGHVLRFPPSNTLAQQPLLIKNGGRGKMAREHLPVDSYFSKKWRGRGTVLLDFDRDGDMDLAFSHVNEPAAILENQTKSNNPWVQLELIGKQSNRNAIGAAILFKSDKKTRLRNIVGGGSYMSQSCYSVQCVIPSDEKLLSVEVKWPNGKVTSYSDIPINQIHCVIEPD